MSRSRLEEALADLLDRHDALRAHFRVRDGEFLQVVAPSAEIEVEVWGAEDGSAAIASARRFAERPFELDASPRLRCGLVEVAGEDPFLVLAVDHVVADGWSLALILDELWEGVTGGGPRPRTAGLSYADAMLREEIWLVGPQADKLFQEMTEELDGRSPYPTLTLPSGDDPRARGQGTARFELDFPADRAAALERSAVEASVAPFVLAAAALAEAIVDCGGEASSFATVLANRDSPGTLETVGYFANHGLVHLDADADLDRTRFLSRARDAVERTLRRQRFPFLELVARLDPPHYGTPPSPYLILNFLDGRTGSISARRSAPGLAWEWHEIEGLGFSPGVIALVHRDGPGWTLEFRYDREAYDEAAVRGLAAAWVSAMDGWGGRHAR
jgi:hypothetical protein